MKRQPKILYLDQFAASNMSANNGIWSKARELVEVAVRKGKIICPIPMEHFIETSGRSIIMLLNTMIGLNQFQEENNFSHGKLLLQMK